MFENQQLPFLSCPEQFCIHSLPPSRNLKFSRQPRCHGNSRRNKQSSHTKPYHYFNNRQWACRAESSRLLEHCLQRVSLLRCLEVLTDTWALALRSCLQLGVPTSVDPYNQQRSPTPGLGKPGGQMVRGSSLRPSSPGCKSKPCAFQDGDGKKGGTGTLHLPTEPLFTQQQSEDLFRESLKF